jgi:hypothetical protein
MKRKKNPGTLVKQKVIFHLFFAVFTPLLFACPETVKKEATKQRKSTSKHMRQSSESHKIDFDTKNVRVRLLIIHKEQFSFVPFSCACSECRVFFGVEGSGQIEINLLLFPSNRLTSEIVLVDLSKTRAGGRERERRNRAGLV